MKNVSNELWDGIWDVVTNNTSGLVPNNDVWDVLHDALLHCQYFTMEKVLSRQVQRVPLKEFYK